jgi:hypothetical protein
MNQNVSQNVIDAIRLMYRNDPLAQRLFDLLAQRERDASVTSIDRMMVLLSTSRGEAVQLSRRLEEAGCGEFIVGRRKQKSRFVWKYSCISLGRAAAEEVEKLEKPSDPLPETEDESEAPAQVRIASLTISEAKEILARTLGVSPSSIEISIRA